VTGRICAVVVTWNGLDCVAQCLTSLAGSEVPVDVLVVDNASTDGTPDYVRRSHPGVELLRLSRNLGFGRANNIGIKHAYDQGAMHVFLLNQDAHIRPDVIGRLADLQRRMPEYGVVSPLHLDGSGQALDRKFAEHIARSSGLRDLLGDLLLGRAPAEVYDVEFVNAAAWLVSRQCIETVGLFNPVFEHYGEDMEYASRVRHLGMRIGVMPQAVICHDREDRADSPLSPQRCMMMDRAMIRCRLARFELSTLMNVLSVLSYSVLAGSALRPAYRRWVHRSQIVSTILREAPAILRCRALTARPGRSFFGEAETDRHRFMSGSNA